MKRAWNIFFRYILAFIFGIFINIFYFIFTPLTVYPVYFILKLFYPVLLQGETLIISTAAITLVPACIAGSAYYLLLILNLLTPIKLKTRIKALIFSFLALLILNIIRIVIFSSLYLSNFAYFDITHWIFWYFLSLLFVFLIWIAEIKIYKIKTTPLYTDLKYIAGMIKKNKIK